MKHVQHEMIDSKPGLLPVHRRSSSLSSHSKPCSLIHATNFVYSEEPAGSSLSFSFLWALLLAVPIVLLCPDFSMLCKDLLEVLLSEDGPVVPTCEEADMAEARDTMNRNNANRILG
jgi:hypothetical protein